MPPPPVVLVAELAGRDRGPSRNDFDQHRTSGGLFGQANASRISARIHSGSGGQTDFIVGALHSAGGQALMALRSWHPNADVSTIVPLADEPVTSFQRTEVVMEQGVAEIVGDDGKRRARQLVEHAEHPRVREELRKEASALGLW